MKHNIRNNMSKVRLYLAKDRISDIMALEDKESLHKAKDVLSLKKGEKIYIFDGEGTEYRYQINEIERKRITLKKEATERTESMPEKIITLGVPLVKEQKMDLILQKATELGIWSFQPFICQRSIREKPSAGKKERWVKIVREAARQSERLWLAQINDVIDFNDLIKHNFSLKLAASIKGQKITGIPEKKCCRILLLIGPEGDFSAEEYEKLKTENFFFLKLSENILRVETASIIASGLTAYFLA